MPALKWKVLAMAGDRGSRLIDDLSESEAAVVHGMDALVERMRSGQERALEELYNAAVGNYTRSVGDSAQRHGYRGNRLQTYAFASAIAGFDASRANLLGWLLMLCRSRALDRLRQRRATVNTLDVVALAKPNTAPRTSRSIFSP